MSNVQVKKTKKLWKIDTQTLVTAALLGAIFVVVQQVAHRIDAAINPSLVIIGGITWATFTGLGVLFLKQPAAMLMVEVQALVAVVTGLSPLAPAFILANAAGSIAYTAASRLLPMETWLHHFWAQLAANLSGNIFIALGLWLIIGLPSAVIISTSLITAAVGTIGAAFLTLYLARAIAHSGVLRREN